MTFSPFSSQIFPQIFPNPSSICAPPGPCHAGGAEEQLGRQERPARAAHGAAPEGAAGAAGRGQRATGFDTGLVVLVVRMIFSVNEEFAMENP